MKKKSIFSRDFFELTGCVHNHSEYSYDSSVPISKIILAARNNELDYFTLNDHLNMQARDDRDFRNEKDILIIAGSEINDKSNNNHFLVFDHSEIIKGEDASKYSKYYFENGVTCFAAHPFEKRICNKFRKYIWTDPENTNFHGLEIWNAVSEWVGKLSPKKNGVFLVFFSSFFIRKPFQKTLNYWDDLAKNNIRKAAIGSTDAHSITHKWMGLKLVFLTHKMLFKTIRTNVLLSASETPSQKSILKALRNGNSYIVNYKQGNPYNFYAGISDSKGKSAIFGEEIEYSENLKFYFRLPKIAKVVLIRSGKKIKTERDEKGYFDILGKGVYRLEITQLGRGWIYTNHIYVI
ncbi:MAG: hypothetical protein K8S23_12775 [Candidatus Cloacimonetes bacterium]|nr:hypothetical protein [Candidatus Cloacimonadota bacterium]